MAQDEYKKVELPAIEQLKQLGWSYINGDELSPEHHSRERNSYKDVVLEKRLCSSIQRINPWINDENLNKVANEFIKVHTATLMEANRFVYEALVHYQSVEQDLGRGRRGQTVKIIDLKGSSKIETVINNQFSEIDVSTLNSGLYLITVTDQNTFNTVSKKVLIN